MFPQLEWEQKPGNNSIFITFDDGPHKEITPWVLSVLERYNAKATFFCVGENASTLTDIMDKIRDNGHSVGNHTHRHIRGWQTNDLSYFRDTYRAVPFTSSRLFRPPYGRIKAKQANMLRSRGFRVIMWSLLSCDYIQSLDRQKSLESLVRNTRPGSIVVFHDSVKARANLQWILPQYLEAMQQKGFQFAPL